VKGTSIKEGKRDKKSQRTSEKWTGIKSGAIRGKRSIQQGARRNEEGDRKASPPRSDTVRDEKDPKGICGTLREKQRRQNELYFI